MSPTWLKRAERAGITAFCELLPALAMMHVPMSGLSQHSGLDPAALRYRSLCMEKVKATCTTEDDTGENEQITVDDILLVVYKNFHL